MTIDQILQQALEQRSARQAAHQDRELRINNAVMRVLALEEDERFEALAALLEHLKMSLAESSDAGPTKDK